MIGKIVIAIVFSFILFSCKKDKPTSSPVASSNAPGPIATLTLSSYPNVIGNSWVYNFYSKEIVSNNNGVATNTVSYNYTVTVIADTTMPNNNTGKIWALTFQNPLANKKLLAYTDNTTGLFKIEEIEYSYNVYFYTTLNYPLSLNKSWENTGQQPLDTSTVTSQESNKLVIDRGYWILNGTCKYKISAKGIVYSFYQRADVTGNQIVTTDYESTLINTNF